MRRVAIYFVVVIFLLGTITGCVVKGDTGNQKQILIGITQIAEHPALDSVRQGILDGLDKNGFKDGEKIKIDVQNAQGEMNNAITIANNFVSDQKDLIVAIATPTAQAAAKATKEIPIVFATVTDPVAAGLVKDLNQTDGNITGTSDQLPMEIQIELIQRFIPNIKDLGVIYSTSEVNAGVQVEMIEEAAALKGIRVTKAGITTSSEVVTATETLMGKVEAILIPVDNTVVAAIEGVLTPAQKGKIPVFASDTDSVKRGAVATYGIDYYQMGVQTGEMVARILNGEKINGNPVEVTKNNDLIINLNAAQNFGLDVSDQLKKDAKEIINN